MKNSFLYECTLRLEKQIFGGTFSQRLMVKFILNVNNREITYYVAGELLNSSIEYLKRKIGFLRACGISFKSLTGTV